MPDEPPKEPSASEEEKVSPPAPKEIEKKETPQSNKNVEKNDKKIAELEKKIASLESSQKAQKPQQPAPAPYVQGSNGSALKIIAVLLGIFFVVSAAAAVYYANEARLNDDCQTNYKGVLGDYNELSSLYSVLNAEEASLEGQVSTLNAQIADLSSQIEGMRESGTAKDSQITSLTAQLATLEAECDELEESVATKETRITYLEVLMDSVQSQNEELASRLELCTNENADLSNLVLHPYVGSFYTSGEEALTIDEVTGIAVEEFYVYLCISCTECDVCTSYCYDPCDPCDPCSTCTYPSCCSTTGPYDAIRLTVRVTTDLDELTQELEVVSWTWA